MRFNVGKNAVGDSIADAVCRCWFHLIVVLKFKNLRNRAHRKPNPRATRRNISRVSVAMRRLGEKNSAVGERYLRFVVVSEGDVVVLVVADAPLLVEDLVPLYFLNPDGGGEFGSGGGDHLRLLTCK